MSIRSKLESLALRLALAGVGALVLLALVLPLVLQPTAPAVAEVVVPEPGPCGYIEGYSTTPADTDGDAIPDTWEESGISVGDQQLDLATMGADPQHKDIFVEIDAMSFHRLKQSAIDKVVAAFLAQGVRLHVDNGRSSTMNPVTGEKWGQLSESKADIAHQETIRLAKFKGAKANNFSAARQPVFHYGMSVHRFIGVEHEFGSGHLPDGVAKTGVFFGIPACDFALTLGELAPKGYDATGSDAVQAAALMHQLGHNLGLTHSGPCAGNCFGPTWTPTGLNHKPNYLSVMNYNHSMFGLRKTTGQAPIVDYSRFLSAPASSQAELAAATADLQDLTESSLSETRGLLAIGDAAEFESIFWCRSGGRSNLKAQRTPMNKSTDWNCNGRIDPGTVGANVNGDGVQGLVPLKSDRDWPQLGYCGSTCWLNPDEYLRAAFGEPLKPQLQAAREVSGDRRRPEIFTRDILIGIKGSLATGARVGPGSPPPASASAKPRRPKAVVVKIIARDRALDQLTAVVDGKRRIIRPRASARKRRRAVLRLKFLSGKHRIRAIALDRTGNRSRLLAVNVKVR